MLRRLIAAIWRGRYASGGTLPPHKPDDDSVLVMLSPGWYEVPPETGRRMPPDFLARLNAPRRP